LTALALSTGKKALLLVDRTETNMSTAFDEGFRAAVVKPLLDHRGDEFIR
jgi:hypothetical protein